MVPPVGLAFWRWTFAALLLAPFLAARPGPISPPFAADWRVVLFPGRHRSGGVPDHDLCRPALDRSDHALLLSPPAAALGHSHRRAGAGDRPGGRQVLGIGISPWSEPRSWSPEATWPAWRPSAEPGRSVDPCRAGDLGMLLGGPAVPAATPVGHRPGLADRGYSPPCSCPGLCLGNPDRGPPGAPYLGKPRPVSAIRPCSPRSWRFPPSMPLSPCWARRAASISCTSCGLRVGAGILFWRSGRAVSPGGFSIALGGVLLATLSPDRVRPPPAASG